MRTHTSSSGRPARAAQLLAGVALLLLGLPGAAPAAPPAEPPAEPPPPASAVEPPFDPSPLPPIELPRKERPAPRAEEPLPPEAPPTGVTPEPGEPPAPEAAEETDLEALRERARDAAGANGSPTTSDAKPAPSEERSAGCLLLQVGAFASDADAGIAADVGIRAKAFSARWAWRLMFSDSDARREVTLNSGRLAWHKEFNKWAGAYVGAGIGSLEERTERYWDGSMMTTGTATVLLFEGGLLVEYGPVSLFGLGLELLLPVDGAVRSAPTVLVSATVSPLLLLSALK